jgi:hypothetical protein
MGSLRLHTCWCWRGSGHGCGRGYGGRGHRGGSSGDSGCGSRDHSGRRGRGSHGGSRALEGTDTQTHQRQAHTHMTHEANLPGTRECVCDGVTACSRPRGSPSPWAWPCTLGSRSPSHPRPQRCQHRSAPVGGSGGGGAMTRVGEQSTGLKIVKDGNSTAHVTPTLPLPLPLPKATPCPRG